MYRISDVCLFIFFASFDTDCAVGVSQYVMPHIAAKVMNIKGKLNRISMELTGLNISFVSNAIPFSVT